MTYVPNPQIKAADSPSIDAFSRWRVSQNNVLHSNEYLYSKNTLFWDETLANGATATLDTDRASVDLSVAGDTESAIRQTKQYFRYTAGQGQSVFCSFSKMNGVASTIKRVGYFDANNGLFLEADGTTINFVRRTYVTGSAVDNEVAQDDWNLDPMDGTGPSGITIDLSKTNILVIDFQWLGVGRVRMGFDVDGLVVYAHEFLNANVLDAVYMSTPALPVRYELSSSGGTATLEQICSAVNREGGQEDRGIITTVTTGLSAATSTSTLRSILAVRLRSSHIRGSIVPVSVTVLLDAAADIHWQLSLNPTLGGALSYSNAGEGIEFSTTQETVTAATGHLLQAGHISTAATDKGSAVLNISDNQLALVADAAGTADQLVLSTEAATGTNDVEATITVLEQY